MEQTEQTGGTNWCHLLAGRSPFTLDVLVPTYDHPNDAAALGILGDLFPGRKVIGIPCEALVAGLGAIHCVTQQEPAIPTL